MRSNKGPYGIVNDLTELSPVFWGNLLDSGRRLARLVQANRLNYSFDSAKAPR